MTRAKALAETVRDAVVLAVVAGLLLVEFVIVGLVGVVRGEERRWRHGKKGTGPCCGSGFRGKEEL